MDVSTQPSRTGLSHICRVLYGLGRRSFAGRPQYDSTAYWKVRAKDAGQASVMFLNTWYNDHCRQRQREILETYVSGLPNGSRVLDIGCGIGVIAKILTSLNKGICVDAVDFEEMVARARAENPDPRINYLASSAEAFNCGAGVYDLVVSAGCYSAIRDLTAMRKAFDNCSMMLKDQGKVVMIDPFHKSRWLARAKFSSSDVHGVFSTLGMKRISKEGILFWPFREWLANSDYDQSAMTRRFEFGERLLKLLGPHAWADYKVLVYKK